MKKAFTLVELLLVIFFLSILGAIVGDFIISSLNQQSQLEGQTQAQTELNLAIDKMTKVIRSTTEVTEASDFVFKIKGYPNVSEAVPSVITFDSTAQGVMTYTVIPPTGTAPNYTYNINNASTFTLMKKLANTSTQPAFVYYDENGSVLSQPYSLAEIRMVGVTLISQPSGPPLHLPKPIQVSTKIQLRNFKTNL